MSINQYINQYIYLFCQVRKETLKKPVRGLKLRIENNKS